MRRRWPACVATAASLLLSGCEWLQPFEQVCEQRLGPAAIAVRAAPISHRVDLTRSSSELSAMGAAVAGRQVLGLTQAQLKWSASYVGKGLTRRLGGQHCTRPVIELHLAFEPVTVLVSREQPQGSCAFNITMDHERKHVGIYERFLDELVPRIEAGLLQRYGNKIFYFDSEVAAERHVQASLRDYLAPVVNESMQEVSRRQAAIDTPEEYFRLESFQQACG